MNMAKKQQEPEELTPEDDLPEAQVVQEETSEPEIEESPLQQAQRESEEYLSNWHRARADYQNLKRRTFDDIQKAVGRERVALLQEMLTILDFLDMALASPAEHTQAVNLKAGVQMTRDQLMAMFERFRVSPMETEEGAFNHELHQAVATVETTDVPAGQIVEVMRRGFMIGDDVLRYAQVRVAAEPRLESEDDDSTPAENDVTPEPGQA